MEIRFDLEMDDLLTYALDHQNQSETARRELLRYRVTEPILWFVCYGVMAFFFPGSWILPMLPVVISASILWYLVSPARWRWAIKRMAKKTYAEGVNRTVLGAHHLTLTPDGIINKTEASETRAQWDAIEKIVNGPEHIYLYIGAVQAHIVPKRVFSDAASLEEFMETMRSYRESAVGLKPGII